MVRTYLDVITQIVYHKNISHTSCVFDDGFVLVAKCKSITLESIVTELHWFKDGGEAYSTLHI